MAQIMKHQKQKKSILVFLCLSMALASAACGAAEQPGNTQTASHNMDSIETEASHAVIPESGTEASEGISTEAPDTSREEEKPERSYKKYETKYLYDNLG